MKISTKGRYALRLMLDLAEHSQGDCVKLKDIADRQQISMKYLEQITSQLTNAGFIKGVRGAQGGYILARKPSQYTVGDVLRVTEGNLAPIVCLDDPVNMCPRKDICPTLPLWNGLNSILNNYLDSKTLKDLM